jgi:hypothetical protein
MLAQLVPHFGMKFCTAAFCCARKRNPLQLIEFFALTCFIRSSRAICIPPLKSAGITSKKQRAMAKTSAQSQGKPFAPTLTQQAI